MKKMYLAISLSSLFIIACSSGKKATKTSNNSASASVSTPAAPIDQTITLDTIVKVAYQNYRPAARIINELRNTSLEVSFDWQKCYLYGKATITLKPYFYPTDSLTLDAKGMDIKEISLLKGKIKTPLTYTYDSLQLHIKLDKTYTKRDSFTVYINYVSMPNKLKDMQEGSQAISSHKGLFFINPDGKDTTKPRQVWTQGETEDNSCWYPTIDKPNQRMTEDIYITAEKGQKTLSNGAMVSSKENADGSHTDHWVMSPGIPPYLVMMAVGPFAVVHDSWRGKPVDFYVDKKYERYAMDIFGNTPEMIEFYSNLLKFPYPWNKYDQVIGHDYVSGAMENTTATLHGTFLQLNSRELLDNRLEGVDDGGSDDIISHELFHHWFGDLVTCESWSNISLNESFATYGEYLWREHKYGRDEADKLLRMNDELYLAGNSQHDLVDFYYADREKDFDVISYQKGGSILHMLRSVLGDSAFFEGLHVYLEEHKFSPVEVPMLRLALEKVSGRDLNWFFNEWFYNKGNPILNIDHSYNDNTHTVTLKVDQVQDLQENPVFKMPVYVDIYYNGTKDRHLVEMDKTKNVFKFSVPVRPDWVDFDAQKMLLAVKYENMSLPERIFQYTHGPLYLDRHEAIDTIAAHLNNADAKATLMKALHDKYWALRHMAIEKIGSDSSSGYMNELERLSSDSCSLVRAAAITALSKNFHDKSLLSIYSRAINDSSYAVEANAIGAMAKLDKDHAMKYAKQLEKEEEPRIAITVGQIYSKYGDDSNNGFFVAERARVSGFEEIPYAIIYEMYLERCSDETINKGLIIIANLAKSGDNGTVKQYAKYALQKLSMMYEKKSNDLQAKMDELKKKNPNDPDIASLQNKIDACTAQESKLNDLLK